MICWKNRPGQIYFSTTSPPLLALRTSTRQLACAAVLFLALGARAQISPGPLSNAHRDLEGVAKCGACHEFGAGSRGFKCLECHVEIRKRLDANAGFHARAYKKSATQTDCSRCHMEHNGQGFVLTRLDRKDFNHEAQTGFRLQGKHREQKCESCHNGKKIEPAQRAVIKLKDINRSFLGLRRECGSCHEDRHGGQLGADCTRCHSQEAWKPASGFNHSQTHFSLTGQHQTVACLKCHVQKAGQTTVLASGQPAILFKGLTFDSCQNCHNDPHRGGFREVNFRGACDTCHNTGGWKNNNPDTGFKHELTRFPLTGKHAEVACAKCHKTVDFHKPIAHERCSDCHQDQHNGQFVRNGEATDCRQCHNETGFKPTRFDTAMHQRAAFPLEGKHATLQCEKCHTPAGKATVYKTGKLICSACHEDGHAGAFAAAPVSNRCDQCHTVAGYLPTTFTVTRHEQTKFPLTGKHATVECASCHKPLTTAAAASGTPKRYRFDSLSCNGCHADPHQTKQACETCHVTQGWKDVRPFDHGTTRFALQGAHLKDVKCLQCHPAAGAGPAPVFAGTKPQCAGCHLKKDVHGGQFLGSRPEDCANCHNSAAWNQNGFSHEHAAFTLDRAHRNVDCVKCHKERIVAGAKPVRTYRGTPLECVQCH